MGNNKLCFLSLAILAFLVGFLMTSWDGSRRLINEMEWVLRELPEVKSVEYLETLKS